MGRIVPELGNYRKFSDDELAENVARLRKVIDKVIGVAEPGDLRIIQGDLRVILNEQNKREAENEWEASS